MKFKKTGHLLINTVEPFSHCLFYAFRDPGVIQVNQTGESDGLDADAHE